MGSPKRDSAFNVTAWRHTKQSITLFVGGSLDQKWPTVGTGKTGTTLF